MERSFLLYGRDKRNESGTVSGLWPIRVVQNALSLVTAVHLSHWSNTTNSLKPFGLRLEIIPYLFKLSHLTTVLKHLFIICMQLQFFLVLTIRKV